MRKLSMTELDRKTIADFKEAPKQKVIVILDNIRSMHNVGSVFRTADAFLIEAIYLCGFTPQPPHRDINKTALGATETVNWQYFETTQQAIDFAKNIDYSIFAVEQVENSISLQDFATNAQKIAVVLGNEVDGVDSNLLPLVDGCIEIPQLGTKHSLNISVAAAIVMWQLVFAKK
jgi:23S rRNA (guanosine2251-2'-O)-methyltransferase